MHITCNYLLFLGLSEKVYNPKLLLFQIVLFTGFLVLFRIRFLYRLSDRIFSLLHSFIKFVVDGKYRPIVSIVIIEVCILFAFYGVQKTYPMIMDEHAHLLIADNFANGLVTGQTHPKHEFFETFFVISSPSYTGKYPPGQGFILALGKLIFGNHIGGVWLTFILGSIITYLLLLNFFSRKWSLIGSLFFLFNVKVLTMWGLSYWGGSLSLLGSALLWFAFFKMLKEFTLKYSFLFGLGFLLMFFNRPFESVLFVLFPAIYLLIYFIKENKGGTVKATLIALHRFITPISFVLIVTVVVTLYYNKQVTGHILEFPHHIYSANYEGVKPFVFQDMTEPQNYPFAEAKVYNKLDDTNHVSKRKGLVGYLRGLKSKFFYYLFFYFEFIFLLPLFFYIKSKKGINDWIFGITLLILFLGSSLVTYEWGHYIAAACPIFIYYILKGGRGWYEWSREHSRLKLLLHSFIGVVLVNVLISAVFHYRLNNGSYSEIKNNIEEKLKKEPKKDLVFVKYVEYHPIKEPWINNSAIIDESSVVWARNLGDAKNIELIEYFNKSRNIWTLNVAKDSIVLKEYFITN